MLIFGSLLDVFSFFLESLYPTIYINNKMFMIMYIIFSLFM